MRPASPRAFEYSFLFHVPWRRSATLSGIRRSSASIRPNASSATAAEFFPGQFATITPCAVAAVTSIVFTPAPARTMSFSDGGIAGAPTFVERTISTSAAVRVTASASA